MISREELSEKLKGIVLSYIPEEEMPENIDYNMDLINDLGVNSMHLIDIVIDVENEYDITISDEELQSMNSLNKVLDVLMKKLEDKE